MKNWKRLLFYVIVNVLVSAATTLLVLWAWERAHRLLDVNPLAANGGTPVAVASPTPVIEPTLPTLPPLDSPMVEISNVFGTGDAQNEVLVLKRVGDGDLWLTGWKLFDEDGNTFTFPMLQLSTGGAVQIHTRPGTNTAIDLFWGKMDPIWRTGEAVMLVDYQGNRRANYKIP